jgi:hypothetical protein
MVEWRNPYASSVEGVMMESSMQPNLYSRVLAGPESSFILSSALMLCGKWSRQRDGQRIRYCGSLDLATNRMVMMKLTETEILESRAGEVLSPK